MVTSGRGAVDMLSLMAAMAAWKDMGTGFGYGDGELTLSTDNEAFL